MMLTMILCYKTLVYIQIKFIVLTLLLRLIVVERVVLSLVVIFHLLDKKNIHIKVLCNYTKDAFEQALIY